MKNEPKKEKKERKNEDADPEDQVESHQAHLTAPQHHICSTDQSHQSREGDERVGGVGGYCLSFICSQRS